MPLSRSPLRRYTGLNNNGGFTLIELMVASFVSVIIVMALSNLFLETQRHNSVEKARVTLIREARQLVSVTGDGFYPSGAGSAFISGLRGSDNGACVICPTTAPSPSPSPGPWPIYSKSGPQYVAFIQQGGQNPFYYTLRVDANNTALPSTEPLYRSNTAPRTSSGYLANIVICCDGYAVNLADGTPATIYTRFNLSEPDTFALLGTDMVNEEIWALYTLNIGVRIK